MAINCLVYFKVIKDIFDTSEQDDYQILSEILQNFLLCIEMFLAALAHHYSYPVHEHQINIPNYQAQQNPRELIYSMFDMNDVLQDGREHLSSVWNSIKKPFRAPDPFEEHKSLMTSRDDSRLGESSRHSSMNFNTTMRAGSSQSTGRASRYGTVDYVHSTVCIAPQNMGQSRTYHQGAPPLPGNLFFGNVNAGEGTSSSRLDSPSTSSSTMTCKKSDSNNTDSWLTNSASDDVINIEVRGVEEDLIKLKGSPPL